jgi:hypothetical protein
VSETPAVHIFYTFEASVHQLLRKPNTAKGLSLLIVKIDEAIFGSLIFEYVRVLNQVNQIA